MPNFRNQQIVIMTRYFQFRNNAKTAVLGYKGIFSTVCIKLYGVFRVRRADQNLSFALAATDARLP